MVSIIMVAGTDPASNNVDERYTMMESNDVMRRADWKERIVCEWYIGDFHIPYDQESKWTGHNGRAAKKRSSKNRMKMPETKNEESQICEMVFGWRTVIIDLSRIVFLVHETTRVQCNLVLLCKPWNTYSWM